MHSCSNVYPYVKSISPNEIVEENNIQFNKKLGNTVLGMAIVYLGFWILLQLIVSPFVWYSLS